MSKPDWYKQAGMEPFKRNHFHGVERWPSANGGVQSASFYLSHDNVQYRNRVTQDQRLSHPRKL